MVKWWPGARGPIEMAFELQAVGDVVRSMKMKMPHLSFFFHRTIGYIALFALTSSLVHRSPTCCSFLHKTTRYQQLLFLSHQHAQGGISHEHMSWDKCRIQVAMGERCLQVVQDLCVQKMCNQPNTCH